MMIRETFLFIIYEHDQNRRQIDRPIEVLVRKDLGKINKEKNSQQSNSSGIADFINSLKIILPMNAYGDPENTDPWFET